MSTHSDERSVASVAASGPGRDEVIELTAQPAAEATGRPDGSAPKAPEAEDAPAVRRWHGAFWPLLVVVVTAALAAVPYVFSSYFYQRGDTAAQFAPTWFHLGELVRSGEWPVRLDPDAWAGGNYAGEALYGVYNPLNVLIWVFVSLCGDLMWATFVVKATVMVALALGTYALAREYRAAQWAAALVAVALPFSGFTLFWDAGSWPSGLIAFAYAPWVWVTFRRTMRGVGSPFWAFLAGGLAVLNGNPYGTLAVVIIGAGLLLEAMLQRQWRGLLWVAGVGLCVAALLPLVYLPLLETSDLAVRSTGALLGNNGKLRPTLGDLFAASSPLHVPPIRAITGPMQVPATYLAWFVLPLLPWLRWETLRRGRELVGLTFITVAFGAITLGPSNLWLFRWPLRVVEYFYLGLLIVVAMLLTAGLARTRVRGRLFATGLVLVAMGWHTWSQAPSEWIRAGAGTALVAGLTALALAAHLILRRTAALATVLLLGVGLVLGLQIKVFGENGSSRYWHTPYDVAAMQQRFAGYEGRTMQFADLKPLQTKGQFTELERQWKWALPGSLYQVAGVDAVNAYTGMGFAPFTRSFCMEYDGLTQACGFRRLWNSAGPGQPTVADVMKLDTVVVQKRLARGVKVPEGWTVTERGDGHKVITRDEPHAFADSRLSWYSESIEVTDARTAEMLEERVDVASSDGGQLVFAMLAWPGWEATLDGEPLSTGRSSIGLLTVDLPAGASGEIGLRYVQPGERGGLAVGTLGAVGAVALSGLHIAALRRRRVDPDGVE